MLFEENKNLIIYWLLYIVSSNIELAYWGYITKKVERTLEWVLSLIFLWVEINWYYSSLGKINL
jgi:hypothetical protein